ncbi:sigma 54-interacting transcriptional regulator [Scopulibacillus cellulosilyticus]|uniref:Sigma 54-interacting transcriptional regulator n=1 Tax=Scopulibacillus cellulosilyticus TaxID=2665665 RepID=A0ABW2PYQ7_9BACL
MKRREVIFSKLKEIDKGEGVSAKELADLMHLDRANVSSDLNQLWKDGKIYKSEGRPVLFSIQKQQYQENITQLDKFVQENKSLTLPVEQGKAAVLYPPKGMNLLVYGETGVGKSMFAEILYRYAVEINKLTAGSPFVTFNCADYANNPQLLLGQLFGVKKGAYTGAIEQSGLIEKADQGVLFLDEVHRLPPEGQEMLFTFMDKGLFRRLGETEAERSAKVLIMAATTENPKSSLLETFTRRIPMVIHLPSLSERSREERYHLILKFLKEETTRLGKDLYVSANTIRSLLYYDCANNVGQLKTDIQLTCARAYADFVTKKKIRLQINSTDLIHYIKEGLYKTKNDQDKIEIKQHQYYIFQPEQEGLLYKKDDSSDQTVYEKIENRFNELKSRGINDEEVDLLMEIDIENYFTQYIKGIHKRINKGEMTKIIDERVSRLTEDIIQYVESKLDVVLSKKVFLGLALHIQTSLKRLASGKRIINPQLNKVRTSYKKEFSVALDCIKMIEDRLNIDLPIDEAGFLTMFFVLDNEEIDENEENISVIVIMHGESTASSIVEVARQLLGTEYAAKAIDMPLTTHPDDIYERVKEYIQNKASQSGALLLVDMGSLINLKTRLKQETAIPVEVIPMVSTAHVLEAVRKAMLGYSLTELYEDLKSTVSIYSSDGLGSQVSLNPGKKCAIVTACTTGEGSARAIKKILESQCRFNQEFLDITPINITGSKVNHTWSSLKENRRVISIVSNYHFKENIPQFSIEDVLNLKAIKEIQTIIDIEETYLKMEETIDNHLLNVTGEAIIPDIRSCFHHIQRSLNSQTDHHDLIGIVLHMSCMVDRLISGEETVVYEGKEAFLEKHRKLYTIIREALQSIEQKYMINISDDEVCYIIHFFDFEQTQITH